MAEVQAIGRNYYRKLKSLAPVELTEEQNQQIADYEKPHELTEEQKKNREEYSKKLFEPLETLEKPLEKTKFWNEFLAIYSALFGKGFQATDDSIKNIKAVMLYFLRDERFFSCERIRTDFSEPSFDKGLLIIGSFGNGKSSIMKTIHMVLQTYPSLSYAFHDANSVVGEFEACKEAIDKEVFWRKMTAGRVFFDDVKTERKASNYGLVELFKDIIERRYERRLLTHMSCNYAEDYPDDLEAGIHEFGERYGPRVYDRLKEDYNIVEFKGKSFRK